MQIIEIHYSILINDTYLNKDKFNSIKLRSTFGKSANRMTINETLIEL